MGEYGERERERASFNDYVLHLEEPPSLLSNMQESRHAERIQQVNESIILILTFSMLSIVITIYEHLLTDNNYKLPKLFSSCSYLLSLSILTQAHRGLRSRLLSSSISAIVMPAISCNNFKRS